MFRIRIDGRLVALALLLSPATGWGQTQEVKVSVDRPAPGVTLQRIEDPRAPWSIRVLEADLRTPGLRLDTGRPAGFGPARRTTSAMAAHERWDSCTVVAAINGDFFKEWGEPISPQVQSGCVTSGRTDGEIRADDRMAIHRAQFGFSDRGMPFIARTLLKSWYALGAKRLGDVASVNGNPTRSGVQVAWAGAMIPDDTLSGGKSRPAYGVHLVVARRSADTLWCVREGEWVGRGERRVQLVLRNLPPADSVALTRSGDTVVIGIGLEGFAGGIRALVGGIPVLLAGGKMTRIDTGSGGLAPRFAMSRHPRTAVGFSADSTRLFFVTVDGRQSASVGMTLPEFARLLDSLGVANALNLDGGGSTTMVVRGAVVNHPSDETGERPVGNSLLLLSREPQLRIH